MQEHKRYGSDIIVSLIKECGIEYVACNPGATFRGLHDSVVNDGSEQNKLKMIVCCHEEISIAIAHGYAKATGKPMAAFVHNIVGLQHASMSIFNAWCDRTPVLVLGATGPMDITQRRPWIDWIHTAHDQAAIVKDYVKWHTQPYNLPSVPDALSRACRIMNTAPQGPVYVCFDAAIQEQECSQETINEYSLPGKFHLAPNLPCASDESLNVLTDKLINAEFPILIVDYTGRNPHSVPLLLELAELLSIAVIDCGGRYNFPNNHPLCITGDKSIIAKADFILALDVNDLYGAIGETVKRDRSYRSHLSSSTKIAHVSLDDFLVSSWAEDYQKLCPVDLSIAADTNQTLPSLIKKCRALLTNTHSDKLKNRFDQISKLHTSMRSNWTAIAIEKISETPLAVPSVLYTVWQAIKQEKWILTNNANTPIGTWTRRLWEINRQGCYLGNSGGVGLGYGIGASIGAALAYRETDAICVDIQTDGDLLYTPSALWTAAHHNIPLLVILMNNRSYYNSEEHAIELAAHRQRQVSNAGIGTKIDNPAVDFVALAKTFDLEAFGPIENIQELQIALQQAIKIIKTQKKLVIIDILIQNR